MQRAQRVITGAPASLRTGTVEEVGCIATGQHLPTSAIFQTGLLRTCSVMNSMHTRDLDTAQMLKMHRICTTAVAKYTKSSTERIPHTSAEVAQQVDGERERIFRILVDLQRGYNCTVDLKQNADRIENNLVLNLSKYPLTFGMNALLRRGVQFAPLLPVSDDKMQKVHDEAISEFLYSFANKLEWANRLSNDRQSNIENQAGRRTTGRRQSTLYCDLKRRFSARVSVISRDLSFEQLQLLSHARDALRKSKPCYTRFLNITPAEWAAIRKLRKLVRDKKIVIRKADKCRQIVVCDYDQYQRAVLRLLNDRNNYQTIPYNGNMRSAALLIQTVRKHEAFLGQNLSRLLLSNTRKPNARVFYGLPKTHKPRDKWTDSFPPLRPICPDVNTETSASGRYLAKFLQPYFEQIPSYLRNSLQLVHTLNDHFNLPAAATFLVADIDSLYPNIPVQDAFDSVHRLLRADTQADTQQVDLVLDLLRVQLENNYFTFGNISYKQIRGIPMGRAWAPAVASIFMSEWDRNFLSSLPNKPIVYRRYIDDIFCLFGEREHAEVASALIDGIDSNIRAGDRAVATDVQFLDLRLRIIPSAMRTVPIYELSKTASDNGMTRASDGPTPRGPTRIHISLHRKDTDLMCMLHHGSAHTRSLKLNVLFGQLVRIFRLSNDNCVAGWHMRQLVDVQLRFRDLSRRDSRTVWSRLLRWVARTLCSPPDVNNSNVGRHATFRTLLRLPFNEKHSVLRHELARVYDMLNDLERECVGELVVVNRSSVSLQRLLF
jgi:hypothetical protein